MSPWSITSLPADPGRPNEDAADQSGEAAVLMDGAGMPAATRAGCHHSVQWFAQTATEHYLAHLQDDSVSMVEALEQTMVEVAALHGDGCDLDAGSPSATVAAVRRLDDRIEYLVLCDSTLGIVTDSGVQVISDDSAAHAGHPLDEVLRSLRGSLDPVADRADATLMQTLARRDLAVRNRPGGFWCVGHRPEAATHAITGQVPLDGLHGIVLASDGAMRLADAFDQLPPQRLISAYLHDGARLWLARTRQVEDAHQHENPWSKLHDDATVAVWNPPIA